MSIKFVQQLADPARTVTIEVEDGIRLAQLVEVFEQFVLACGYAPRDVDAELGP